MFFWIPSRLSRKFQGEQFGEVEEDPHFPPVPSSYMDGSCWKLLWNTPIHHREPVHLIEARSVLAAFKHRCRDSNRHGRRIVVLNDNMGFVLAAQKGRCTSYSLLRLLRRLAAHSLVTGCKLSVRWVPSELNVADQASRAWEPVKEKKLMRPRQTGFQAKEERSQGLHTLRSPERQCQDEKSSPRPESSPKEIEIKVQAQRAYEEGSKTYFVSAADSGSETEETESHAEATQVRAETSCLSRRERVAGDSLDQGTSAPGLCAEAERVLQLCGSVRARHLQREKARRGVGGLLRPHVPERRVARCRKPTQSCTRVSSSRSSQRRDVEPAEISAKPQGMEEDGSKSDALTDGRVHQELHLWDHVVPRLERDGLVQRAELLDVRPAGRAAEDEGMRCGAQEECRGSSFGDPGPLRTWREQQNWDLRRSVDPGGYQGQFSRPNRLQPGQAERASGGPGSVNVGLQCKKVPADMEGVCGSSRCSQPCNFSIPESSWRSVEGSPHEIEVGAGDPTTRKMGLRHVSQDLRQARSSSASSQQDAGRPSTFRRVCSQKLRRLVPRWESSNTTQVDKKDEAVFQGMIFLSLFGGVGNPAKFFSKHGGEAVVVDLDDSPSNDLGIHPTWNEIDKILHMVDIVGIDLPCNTWSRARRAPWWSRMPKPLRKPGNFIFGLPGLSFNDAAKVTQANISFRRAIRIIRRCLKTGKRGYLENPWPSMVWTTPEIQRLLRDSRVHLVKADMCQYDCAWKKPTGILFWNVVPTSFMCCNGKQVCSRTNKHHLQLSGISGGKFLTQQAQIYSKRFSQDLMLNFQRPTNIPP